jgi:hypothetical protein
MIKRIVLIGLLAAAAGLAQTVNCIVAVVNGGIITLLDVEVAAEFGLGPPGPVEAGRDPRLAALDALIDRKVVLDLARDVRGLTGEELDAALAGLRREQGEAAFAAKLRKFGLLDTDLERLIEDRVLYDRAMALRFSPSIPIPLTEIERYYRDIYAPDRTRRGLPVEPLDGVAGAIETRLRDERRAKQMSDWVKDLRKRADIQIRKDCLK